MAEHAERFRGVSVMKTRATRHLSKQAVTVLIGDHVMVCPLLSQVGMKVGRGPDFAMTGIPFALNPLAQPKASRDEK